MAFASTNVPIEARLENIEALLKSLLARLDERGGGESIEAIVEKIASKSPAKPYYGVAEVAELVRKSPYQVRVWCREGRIKAERRGTGRGRHREWMVSREELDRYQSRGLFPPNN